MDYFKNRKYEIIRMIFLIISGAIGHSKNDLFSYRISLQSYIKSFIQVVLDIGSNVFFIYLYFVGLWSFSPSVPGSNIYVAL